MAPNNTYSPFPEPFGSVPVLYDVVPTGIFILGFASLTGVNIFHLFTKTRHTGVRFASILVPIERLIVLSFRITESVYVGARESWGFLEYPQVALGTGMIVLCQEQMYLLLCAVTSATREGVKYEEWLRMVDKDSKMGEHRREERMAIRRWSDRLEWVIAALQLAQFSAAFLSTSMHQVPAVWVNAFRFCSNSAIFFTMIGLLSAVHKHRETETINTFAIKRQRAALSILLMVPMYRTAASFQTIKTLSASSSNVTSKVFFYLCQILPELIACTITISTDYRALYDTGTNGDWPRYRVERGLPKYPRALVMMGHFFMPWKWHLWTLFMSCKDKRDAKKTREQAMVEERENLLPLRSSAGWASAIELSSLGGTPTPSSSLTIQASNQEMTSAWPTMPSRPPFKPFSSTTSYKSSASTTTTSPPQLITEVNLWTPTLPSAFSSRDQVYP